MDSNSVTMQFGVPQGSVLGSLLFLICITDLCKVLRHSTTSHFADDANLLVHNKPLKQLRKHLNLESMNGNLPSVLNNNFICLHNLHDYITSGSLQRQVKLPEVDTHVFIWL